MLQSDPSPAELAEKMIDYAEAKTAHFQGIARGGSSIDEYCDGQRGEAPELDTSAAAFAGDIAVDLTGHLGVAY